MGDTSAGQTVLHVSRREDMSTSGGNTVWSVREEGSDIGFGWKIRLNVLPIKCRHRRSPLCPLFSQSNHSFSLLHTAIGSGAK